LLSTTLKHVFGYAVGLDMTRRDLQRQMGDEKKPWEVGKSFDHAAVISHLHPASKVGHFSKGAIWLKVNGATKQSSDLSNMIWSVAEQVANLSRYYELFPGDIIYCGTPENVGPVVAGDVMTGHIDGIYEINVKVV
jgi:fumarylpyruvate hydrolase